ncbi:MAG: hypothetical protein KDC80_18930 [Saprospiraceae bacterium]|nr:hypothetical protein [Saprospiraceae bacterium]
MTQPVPDLSITGLFALVWKHRRFLAILSIITIVVSSVISLLLTEYYRSTVVIFPARTNSLTLNESNVRRGNISDFGEEEEAEQLLQIINSEELFERVVVRNDLYDHYEINAEDRYARSKIRQKYRSNITAKRTKYNSIDISVVDIDPVKAAEIANSIAEFTDSVKNRMIRERASTSLEMLKGEEQRLQAALTKVNTELNKLQALGVLSDIERSGLYEAYGEALRNANSKATLNLQEAIEANKQYGDEYDAMKKEREVLTDQMMKFINYKNQFIADTAIDIPQKFVVDRAIPADKKAYPIRWLVVAGAWFAVILFALILLILRENKDFFFKDEKGKSRGGLEDATSV